MVCNEPGHSSRKCNCLWADLNEGFYSGGGGGGHSHGEEDAMSKVEYYSAKSIDIGIVDNFVIFPTAISFCRNSAKSA